MAVDSSVLIEHTTLQCQGLPQDAPCPHRVIVRPIVIDLSLAHRWISRFRYLFEEILQLSLFGIRGYSGALAYAAWRSEERETRLQTA